MKRADDWRAKVREQTKHDVTLPSGMIVTVIDFDGPGWLMAGRLPERIATQYLLASKQPGEPNETTVDSLEQLKQMTDFMRLVVSHCVVEPRIVLGDPQTGDEIGIAEIPTGDLTFLFRYLTKQDADSSVATSGKGKVTVKAVESFRESSGRAAAAGSSSDGSRVRGEAERTVRHW